MRALMGEIAKKLRSTRKGRNILKEHMQSGRMQTCVEYEGKRYILSREPLTQEEVDSIFLANK